MRDSRLRLPEGYSIPILESKLDITRATVSPERVKRRNEKPHKTGDNEAALIDTARGLHTPF